MSKKQNLIFFTVLLVTTAGLFFAFNDTEAYGTGSTHPFLTKQIANLYNEIYTPKLTSEQIGQMVEGTVDEDTTPRWVNHFYDPTTGEGLLGKRLGDLQSEEIIGFIKVIFNEIPASTLDWVHNQELQQNSYAYFEGNRTFESAALSYVDGDENGAYRNLGYVLHDIEDMAVPAHTRQDSHFDLKLPDIIQNILPIKLDKGEPYEKWAESYTRNSPADLVEKLKKNYTPICNSLDDCLKVLADYSNSSFFSSDTILDEEYGSPEVKSYIVEGDYINAYGDAGILLFKTSRGDWQKSIEFVDINQAYWDKLAPKAVLAGVEVVKYFQDQAEKAKKGEITIDKVSETINPVEDLKHFSPYGQFVLMYNEGKASVQDFWNRLRNLPSDFASHALTMYDEGKANLQEFWNKLRNFPSDLASKFNDMLDGLGITALMPSSLPGSTTPKPDIENGQDQPNIPPPDVTTAPVEPNVPTPNKPLYTGTGGPDPALMTEQERQDLIDDIAEQLDIIAQQVQELIDQQNKDKQPVETDEDKIPEDEDNQDQQNPVEVQPPPTSGGGGSSVVYSKILISEVQVAGTADSKEEFVELYNPNDSEIDLTSWYLQRKTSTGSSYSTFAPNTLFSGKRIGAKGYFVIARTGYFSSIANILVDNPITDDNSFVLKNPNGDVSDKLGFGQAQDYESAPTLNPGAGQSIGRKVLTDGTEQDTDNNLVDFELQTPTPKAQNTTYIAPSIPGGGDGGGAKDITAPSATFTLDAIQNSLNFVINFTITDPLVVVSPSGVDGFVFRWKEGNNNWLDSAYQDVVQAPAIYSGTRDFTGEDEKTYYFQIKAKDVTGNESDWLPEIPATTKISIPKVVLINEVQIAGLTDEKEEFVELYNPGLIDIDLTGWYVHKKVSADYSTFISSTLFSGKKIKSKGYFLISREESSFTKLSDIVITGSLGEDSSLIIKNPDRQIIDKVGWGQAQDFETDPTSNPGDGQSIQRKWNLETLQHQDTDNNLADFEIQTPNPKPSSPKSYIWDGTGNVAEGVSPDYSVCMGSSLPGTLYYYLKIKWQSPSAVTSYQVQYKLNNNEWKDWLADTVETEGSFQTPYSLFNDNIYLFRVRAKDAEGNVGDFTEIEKEVNLVNPVSINEVALFGTNEQWVELYNKSDSPVNLTGWKLVSDNGTVNLEGTILAKGYLLLERNDTNFTVPLGTSSLKLTNENNRYIDQIYTPQGGWTSNNFLVEGNYHTLERISAYSFGIDNRNWRVNSGTPASQNSVYQIYTSYYLGFQEDTTLRKELSPYLFSGPWVWVFKGHTLTIEPGTVIKFSNGGLTVEGTLNAVGTLGQKIILTSIMDDEYAGDTDEDAGVSPPNPGNWYGIYFTKDSTNSKLENVSIRYAGGYYGGDFGAAIKADRSTFSLKNSVIEKNRNNGLHLINSHSVIDSVQFIENKNAELTSGARAIYIEGANPEIRNCYFKDNKYGIYINYWDNSEDDTIVPGNPVIENNIFEQNSTPIWIGSYAHPSLANNSGTGNDRDAIVYSGPIEDNTTLNPNTLPYFIETNVTVAKGATLTIEPATTVKFSNSGLFVNGTLKAIGTSDNPIIFKPYHEADWVSPGNWRGIYFTKDSTNSELENVNISYAGGFFGSDFGAAIRVDQSTISLKNSFIHDNANTGLWLVNSNSIIDSVQLSNHTMPKDPPSEPEAVYINGGAPEIKNSHFQTNYYGIYKTSCPLANLHTLDPFDPEKNTFINTIFPGGDILDTTPP